MATGRRMIGLMVALLVLGGLCGCVSFITDHYLDDRCANTRIECSRDSTGTSKIDQKAWELDKKIGAAVHDAAVGEPEQPNVRPTYEDPNEIACDEDEVKICSATEGCRCD